MAVTLKRVDLRICVVLRDSAGRYMIWKAGAWHSDVEPSEFDWNTVRIAEISQLQAASGSDRQAD